MTNTASSLILAILTLSVGACSSANSDGARSPSQGARQTLEVSGECTFESCGTVPPSLEDVNRVSCSPVADSCTWSDAANNASVSYRTCAESECPSRPATGCPTGTTQAVQSCGSENEAPCSWTTTCVPPRITTPCADADGCNEQPLIEIGIICKDGSTGGFACVTDGQRCFWERNCD